MGSHGGSHYYCSLQSAKWSTAYANCQSLGGQLAVINNASENAFLANALQATAAWVGGHDTNNEGQFEWVDGSPFSYTNWYAGQPNNYNGSQDFVELLKSGEWNDQYGTVALEYICEFPSCISTTQTAGPAPGSVCPPGVHTVSYRVEDGCGNVKTCSFTVTVNAPTPPPAPGFCASGGQNSTNSHIHGVQFNSIKNVSGNDGGYGNFTNMCTTVDAGSVYPLHLAPGFGSASAQKVYWTCWIDYNMDGDFNDSFEFVAYGCGSKTLSGSITIPYAVWNGTTRMRCTMKVGGYATDPCAIYQYGETEDYCVTITGADFTEGDKAELETRTSPWADAVELGSELSDRSLVAYPNPVSHTLSLQVGGADQVTELEIFSADGRRMLRQTTVTSANAINVSDLENGIYMVKATYDNGEVLTEKIIVQH